MGRRSDQQVAVQFTCSQGLKLEMWRGTTAGVNQLLGFLLEPITPATRLSKQLTQQDLNHRRVQSSSSGAAL